MSILFEPCKIGPMEIRNRFIRSATTSYWSDTHGVISSKIINHYSRLSKGGVGLVIKGHLYVTESGKAHVGMAGISGDYHVPKLSQLTDEVHRNDGKIIAQLNHGGIHSIIDKAGPSEYVVEGHRTRSLSKEEICDIIDAFH